MSTLQDVEREWWLVRHDRLHPIAKALGPVTQPPEKEVVGVGPGPVGPQGCDTVCANRHEYRAAQAKRRRLAKRSRA